MWRPHLTAAGALLLLLSARALVVPVDVACSRTGACVSALNAALATCAAARAPCTIALSAGVYALADARGAQWVRALGVHDVAIVGAGPGETTLAAADLAYTFVLGGVVNVSFAELAIDMARPPFTLARVRATAGGVSELDVDASAYPINTTAYPWLAVCQAIIGYDVAAGRMARGGVDDYFLDGGAGGGISITYSGVAPALSMRIPTTLPVGADVIVRHQVRVPGHQTPAKQSGGRNQHVVPCAAVTPASATARCMSTTLSP